MEVDLLKLLGRFSYAHANKMRVRDDIGSKGKGKRYRPAAVNYALLAASTPIKKTATLVSPSSSGNGRESEVDITGVSLHYVLDDSVIVAKPDYTDSESDAAESQSYVDAVLLNCYYYLKDSDMYSFVTHLPEMGSRINKHWFLVQNSKSRTDALLTMLEWSKQCILPCTKQTKKTLSDLFTLLEHPYISPIFSTDLMLEHHLVIMIQPYRHAGSLKDLIYSSHPRSSWLEKYEIKGKGLTLTGIKNYGRQILEALIYLREKGLPPCTHVHSGNIFLVDGICKVSGYEYTFLGYKARLYPLLRKPVKDNQDAVEVVSFGHLLFEMAAGYELNLPEPVTEQLVSCHSSPVVEVLNFIFFNESGSYPYLEEVADHKFFRDADIGQLKDFKGNQVKFSPNIKALLKLFKNEGEPSQRHRRKSSYRRKYRVESVGSKRERKGSKSKSKRNSVDSTLPGIAFKAISTSAPHPPPVFGSPQPPPPPNVPKTISEAVRPQPPDYKNSKNRGALLTSIRKGTKLKKTKSNDQSTLRV